MNKERLEMVGMTREVVRASLTDDDQGPTRRMARVIESRLDLLIAAEKRAIVQMENYRDNATTIGNYERATESLETLTQALDAAVDEDWTSVDQILTGLYEPEES